MTLHEMHIPWSTLIGSGAAGVIVTKLWDTFSRWRGKPELRRRSEDRAMDALQHRMTDYIEMLQKPAESYTAIMADYIAAIRANGELTAKVSQHDAEITALKEAAVRLQMQVTQIAEERDGLRARLTERDAVIATMIEERRDRDTQFAQVSEERRVQEDRIASKDSQITSLNAAIQEYAERLRRCEIECEVALRGQAVAERKSSE